MSHGLKVFKVNGRWRQRRRHGNAQTYIKSTLISDDSARTSVKLLILRPRELLESERGMKVSAR